MLFTIGFLGGWVDTHHVESAADQNVLEMNMDNLQDQAEASASNTQAEEDDGEEVPVDMEEFEEAGLLDEEDESTVVNVAKLKLEDSASALKDGGEIVQTRTYDLHITYDKYYQTPRLWLFGYDEVSFCVDLGFRIACSALM